MNRIDLSNLGGFPFEQDTLAFMQEGSADMFAAFAAMLGDKRIVSGVQVAGSTVGDGWISYGGEIIKFIGGATGSGVVIQETVQNVTFEDGSVRGVYKTRTATVGSPGTFPFADLKPANVGVPAGTVVMWSGEPTAIPAGWQLHLPLAGRFVVGYDATTEAYGEIGIIGGAATVTLTVEQMPTHSHTFASNSHSHIGSGKVAVGGEAAEGTTPTTLPMGGSQPHENRPPFYVLAYIIKL